MDCPELFGYLRDKKDCVKQYSLDQCCIVNTVCGEENIAKLATCTVGEKTYREGESIYPHPYYSCICGPNFNENDFENSPHCRKINCGIDHERHNIYRGCIPIYYGTSRGCPIEWRCRKYIIKLFSFELRLETTSDNQYTYKLF